MFKIEMMNRIDKLFKDKQGDILSVYFTAGYPNLDSTIGIVKALSDAGADMIEIGMPFSDPMADGPVIQHSNEIALKNGMTLNLLLNQLQNIRKEVDIPILLMGYLNPVIQFGVDAFCRRCAGAGVDGVILPDLPPEIYTQDYKPVFEENNLYNILLITPQSDAERIRTLDNICRGFVYLVSSSAVTGATRNISEDQLSYFKRVKEMKLKNPGLIGFGIYDHDTFENACRHSSGGIIGSAFVKLLGKEGDSPVIIRQFVKEIRNNH